MPRYLGMWMAMMLPMMLPSLIPMLSRYRRSLRGANGVHLHGLTAVVGAGYYAVWAAFGVAAWAATAGVTTVGLRSDTAARWLPVAAGISLLLAGVVQLGPWKARRLALCREAPDCGRPTAHGARAAWRHGLGLGLRCGLCCGNLMLALLAIGMMDPVAMTTVTLAVSFERLTRAPLRAARITGVAIVLVGGLKIWRGL